MVLALITTGLLVRWDVQQVLLVLLLTSFICLVLLDIKATIPSEAAAAESARQAVREKYAAVQVAIDAAPDVMALKTIVEQL